MSETLFGGNIILAPDAAPFYGRVVVEQGRIAAIERLERDRGQSEPVFILPGLIDAHTHPMELGLEKVYVSFSAARSVDDVLQAIAEGRHVGTESGVMFGFNLEPDALDERRYPLMAELDRVSGSVPTLVYRVDGHSAVVNRSAFERGLVDSNLSGCELDEQGRPTGVLRGAAYESASRRFKSLLRRETIRRALEFAADAAARQGVTTIAALVGSDDLDRDEWQGLLDDLSGLKVRAVPYVQTTRPELAAELGLGSVGGCLLLDGSLGSHTAALSQDYADAPGNSGVCYFEDERLVAILRRAEERGLQTAFHAIGDRAIEQLVRCHERVKTSARLRHRIEHAELLPDLGLVDRIARLGLVVCVQPVFEAWWGGPDRMYAQRLGERWRRTNPYRTMLDSSVRLAGGSDAPITPIDPRAGVGAAVALPNADQRVTPEQAMAMFTTEAAYSLLLEDRTGRIAVGFDADFVVLSRDPRKDFGARIRATYRAGNCVFRRDAEQRDAGE